MIVPSNTFEDIKKKKVKRKKHSLIEEIDFEIFIIFRSFLPFPPIVQSVHRQAQLEVATRKSGLIRGW